MDAYVRGPCPAGTNGVEQLQFPVGSIDGESADHAFLGLAHAIRFIGGIETRSGGVQSQTTRARAHLVDAGGRQRSGGAIHLKEVDAATVAGRQVHLGWQDVAKGRTKRADIGDERSGGFFRASRVQTHHEEDSSGKRDRTFRK
jgi:hypothetical protein